MFDFIVNNWETIVSAITSVIAAAAAVAAVTPSKTDDAVVQKVLDVVNVIGLNVGKAKNADAEDK